MGTCCVPEENQDCHTAHAHPTNAKVRLTRLLVVPTTPGLALGPQVQTELRKLIQSQREGAATSRQQCWFRQGQVCLPPWSNI